MRTAWGPACKLRPSARFTFWTGVPVTVDGRTLPVWQRIDAIMKAHGYRPKSGQTWGYNCFGGETEVLTWAGVRPIGKLAGDTHRLMTTRGQWIDAEVRSFGRQRLRTVTLRRNGREQVIRATPDHRWLLTARDKKAVRTNYNVSERTTDQLRAGDRMASAFRRSVFANTPALAPSPFGIAHGFVFGDGTTAKGSAAAYFVGVKDEALRSYFPGAKGRRESGLPFFFKQPPPIGEAPGYLLGWLSGYFAADGRVSSDGAVEINSARREHLEAVELVCLHLGIATYGITSVMRQGYGKVATPLYSLRLARRDLAPEFFILPDHRQRFDVPDYEQLTWEVVSVEDDGDEDEVFCAIVPGTEAFALVGNVLTGNCRKITGGSGYSLHAYGIAVDVNSLANPYGPKLITDMPTSMIEQIEALRTVDGHRVVGWGGRYSRNKDAMHFEVIVTPAQLARGFADFAITSEESGDMDLETLQKELGYIHPKLDKLTAEVAELEVRQGQLKDGRDAILVELRQHIDEKLDAILAKLDS